jgi:hypothetical protein
MPFTLHTHDEINNMGARDARRAIAEFLNTDFQFVISNENYFDMLLCRLGVIEKAPPRTDFWRLRVLIGNKQGKYNKVNNQEFIPILNSALKLDTIGMADDDYNLVWWQNIPEIVIAKFIVNEYPVGIRSSVASVFPGVVEFEFVVRHTTTGEDTTKNFMYAEINTFRAMVSDKIQSIEKLRLETLEKACKWAPKFKSVLSGKLVTYVNHDEDEQEPSPKRRKVQESDDEDDEEEDEDPAAAAQDVSFAGIELRDNVSSLRNLRTRTFKGDENAIDAHVVYVLGCITELNSRFAKTKYLPFPRAPTFTSGAEMMYNGDLDDPNDDIECDTAVTQRLVELNMREPYEDLQKSVRELNKMIWDLLATIRDKFQFFIRIHKDGSQETVTISDLTHIQEYVIGLLYLYAISYPDEEDEDDDEDGDVVYGASSGESSGEEEEDSDSDAEEESSDEEDEDSGASDEDGNSDED